MCKLNFHYIFYSNIFHFTSQRSKQTRQDIQSNNVTKIIVYVNKIKHSTIKAAKKKKKRDTKRKKKKIIYRKKARARARARVVVHARNRYFQLIAAVQQMHVVKIDGLVFRFPFSFVPQSSCDGEAEDFISE